MADRRFTFGKYKGLSILSVIERDPEYVRWCTENIEWFELNGNEMLHLYGVYVERGASTLAPPPEVEAPAGPTIEDLEAYDNSFSV